MTALHHPSATLLYTSRLKRTLRSHPAMSGRDYESQPRRRKLAFLRDFRRMTPFAKRQQLVAMLRAYVSHWGSL